jgi:hypothetical protein
MPDHSKKHAGRPDMPAGYGLSEVKSADDLVAWEHVDERLRTARNYWVNSTRPGGRPHAMPVWGVWVEGAFLFSTDPHSRKGRNLEANPAVVVHLESGDDVVILEGIVEEVSDAALLTRADQAYFDKYQFHLAGDQAPAGLVYRLRPRKIFAWPESSFPTSATRWLFEV